MKKKKKFQQQQNSISNKIKESETRYIENIERNQKSSSASFLDQREIFKSN